MEAIRTGTLGEAPGPNGKPAPHGVPAPGWWTLEQADVREHRLVVALEVYRQAADNARMYANSRFSNLSAFLTYVSLITAGIAVLISSIGGDGPPERLVAGGTFALAAMGLLVSGLFFQLEFRHHHWWHRYEYDVVAEIERQVGFGQHPHDGGTGGARRLEKRAYRRADPRRYASATRATYGIYLVSILFFAAVLAFATAMLAGVVPLTTAG